MARYLNSAKIGLLALIELYAEGAVPNDASLPVLSFIASHILDTDLTVTSIGASAQWGKSGSTVRLVTSVTDFEQLLSPYSAAVGLPGRRLWDIFLQKIWNIDSLDALHSFFGGRQLFLSPTKAEADRMAELGVTPPPIHFSRNSPFGTFIRRSHVEFVRLRFQDATELWKDFVRFRQPTGPYFRRRNPSFGRLSFDNVLLTGQHEWGDNTGILASVAYGDTLTGNADDTGPASSDDVERLLEFQVNHIQSASWLLPFYFSDLGVREC